MYNCTWNRYYLVLVVLVYNNVLRMFEIVDTCSESFSKSLHHRPRCRFASFDRLPLQLALQHARMHTALQRVQRVLFPAFPASTFHLRLRHIIIIRLSKARKDPLSTLKRMKLPHWRPIPCFLLFQRYVGLVAFMLGGYSDTPTVVSPHPRFSYSAATDSLEPRPALMLSRVIFPSRVASLPPFRSC